MHRPEADMPQALGQPGQDKHAPRDDVGATARLRGLEGEGAVQPRHPPCKSDRIVLATCS